MPVGVCGSVADFAVIRKKFNTVMEEYKEPDKYQGLDKTSINLT